MKARQSDKYQTAGNGKCEPSENEKKKEELTGLVRGDEQFEIAKKLGKNNERKKKKDKEKINK